MTHYDKDLKLNKKKQAWKICLVSFSLVILSLIIFDVPYIGSVLDAIFFEFLFGWTKIYLYIYFVLLILSIVIKPLKYIYQNKTNLLFIWFGFFVFGFIVQGVQYYIYPYNINNIKQLYIGPHGYITLWNDNIFKISYQSPINYSTIILCKSFSYGGLLFLCFYILAYICLPVFIVLVALSFTIIFFLIFFKTKSFVQLKNKIIKWLGGYTSKEVIIKPAEGFKNVYKFDTDLPSFKGLKINYCLSNDINLLKIKDKLRKNLSILFEYHIKEINSYFEYFNYYLFVCKLNRKIPINNWKVREQDIENNKYYLWIENDLLFIKTYKSNQEEKIKYDYLLDNENYSFKLPLGIAEINNVISHDFINNGNLIVYGDKGTGARIFITQIVKYFDNFNHMSGFKLKVLANDEKHIKDYNFDKFDNLLALKNYINKLKNKHNYNKKITIIYIDKSFVDQELINYINDNISVNDIGVYFIINMGNEKIENHFINSSYIVFKNEYINAIFNEIPINLSSNINPGEFIYISKSINVARGQIAYVK